MNTGAFLNGFFVYNEISNGLKRVTKKLQISMYVGILLLNTLRFKIKRRLLLHESFMTFLINVN